MSESWGKAEEVVAGAYDDWAVNRNVRTYGWTASLVRYITIALRAEGLLKDGDG